MLEYKIWQAIRSIPDGMNNDFALFCHGGYWMAMASNPCEAVLLGESSPAFEGEGNSPEDAVDDLIKKIASR